MRREVGRRLSAMDGIVSTGHVGWPRRPPFDSAADSYNVYRRRLPNRSLEPKDWSLAATGCAAPRHRSAIGGRP